MPVYEPFDVMTPFGEATCTERVDGPNTSFWICWPKETSICFWFPNQEVRLKADWSDKRYGFLPFDLAPDRVRTLDLLGRHHRYWRENIHPGKNSG